MILANFDLYSKFRTKFISTENLSVLFQVLSAVGAISQLKFAKVHDVACQKIVRLNLVRNTNARYYLNSPYP